MNRRVMILLITFIVIGIYLYKGFSTNDLNASEKQANKILDIPIIVIKPDNMLQHERLLILNTLNNEPYGYHGGRNMRDNDELDIFIQFYGVKKGYEIPLILPQGYIVEEKGYFDINNVRVLWEFLEADNHDERELIYTFDLDKSRYCINAKFKNGSDIYKINEYVKAQLEKNSDKMTGDVILVK